MAGSLKYFVYTTNSGDLFAIFQDESNGEAVDNDDYSLSDTAVKYMLPRNVKPRSATYRSTDGRMAKRIVICDNTKTIDNLPSQIQVVDGSGTLSTLVLTNFQGEEVKRIPIEYDTGLNDGDAG